MTTYHLTITHDDDLSPHEFAAKVSEVLQASALTVTRVQYSDLDTIIWTAGEEKKEQIEYRGHGYGAPRHLAILERAGYG